MQVAHALTQAVSPASVLTESPRALYTHAELDRLVDPKIVAIVGASETPGSFGERTLSNMAGFTGEVFAVNPKSRTLMGRSCVPSLADLPRSPDCVILCVARALVHGMIEAAGAIGAGGAIVYASGYGETGKADRSDAQAALVATARRIGLPLAGPNCVGLANTRSRAGMNFMPDYAGMGHRRGPVAIVSQSGALGYTVLQGMQRGIGFSHYLAAGNSSDVEVADFIAYLAADDEVRSIIALFEGVKDGARFLQAAELARQAGKALIVYKAGNSEISSRAALSHTGTMVGAEAAYRAAFERAGAVVADNLEEVLELASFFARSGPPTGGHGVGILSTSGGAAVICADKAEAHGVVLPPLAPDTAARLHTVVPDFGSVANPADLTAEVLKTAETFSFCLDAFLADPGYSGYVIPMVFAHDTSSVARAPMIIEAAQRTERPLTVVWMNEWLEGPGTALFDANSRVSIFRSADRCLAAFRAWFDWHEVRGRPADGAERRSTPGAAAEARAIIAETGGRALSETASKRVLAAYGIPVPGEKLARDPDEAAEAAGRIGFPAVVKIASADIPHKTEVDGIRLGLRSAAEVHAAAAEVLANADRHAPGARIDGVSVQQMLPSGVELVLGVKLDSQFGPLVAIGLGGVMVELLSDSAVRLAPVSGAEAHRMLSALKGYRLLTGFRGGPPADLEGLVDAICRLSELAHDLADVIEEIDVNPLIVSVSGAVAADALVVTRA